MVNKLAVGWIEVNIGSIVSLNRGRKPSSTIDKSKEGYLPYILIDEMEGSPVRSYTNDPKVTIAEEKDILLVWDGSIGKCGSGLKGAIGSTLVKLSPLNNVPTKFVEYIIVYKNDFIKETSTGSGLQHINKDFLTICKIPLPPLNEQKRIAAKLDQIFSRIDVLKERMEKIPKVLKKFRQAVLATAVDNNEEEITKNICEEIQIGPFGTQLHKHEYISNGIPLVNPTHIQGGEIIPDMNLTISKIKFQELPNYHLKEGDIIMGRRGEMARCALISKKENGWLCGTGSLFFRPNQSKVNPQYLYWALSSSNTKAFLDGEAKGTTMSNLNLSIARNIPITLPSIEEQIEIVKRVDTLFKKADEIEKRFKQLEKYINKLPQSVLEKAFKGELVAQDPEDEPAEVLLGRMRKEIHAK